MDSTWRRKERNCLGRIILRRFVILKMYFVLQYILCYYHHQACYFEKQKYIDAGMKAIEGALGALMRDKIEQSKHYDVTGIPRCLLLRSKLMLEAKEPI